VRQSTNEALILGPGGGNVQPSYAFGCAFGQSDATNPAISFPEIMRVGRRRWRNLRRGASPKRRLWRSGMGPAAYSSVSRGNIVDAMRKLRITQQSP